MRIGVVFAGDTAAPLEALLVRELLRQLPDVHLLLFTCGAPSTVDTWAERLRNAVDARLARSSKPSVPFASLRGASAEIMALADNCSMSPVAAPAYDAIIDLGATIDGRHLATLAPRVYQLWCDDQRETLRFHSLLAGPRDRRRRLLWTVRRAAAQWPVIVAESSLLWMPATVSYNRDCAAGRAIALLMRTLRAGLDVGDGPAWQAAETRRSLSPTESLVASAEAVTSALMRRVRRVWSRPEVWFIAYRAVDSTQRVSSTYRRWGTDHRRWVADPFAFRHEGVDYLFYEEFSYSTGRGIISWTSLRSDGTLQEPEVALERAYHLSYPYIFKYRDEIFMIPESAENRSVDLYRAVDFPRRWELDSRLLSDVNAVDATLHFDGATWWMFVNIGEYGSSTWDELFLFSADSPRGPWRPHVRNPVKTDASCSRPAGRLFRRDGMLIRPTQDCSVTYGGKINLCAVDVLNESQFSEHIIGSIGPEALPGTAGVHTWNATEGLEVLDGKLGYDPRWRSRVRDILSK